MRAVLTHVWKEWRDHRAILVGIAIAIPVLTVVGCFAFSEYVTRLALAAPMFVGGATMLTVFALSTELWAGESRRDTLSFMRRLPRGLFRAYVSKSLFYLLASAGTAAYAAIVFALVGRLFGGPEVAAAIWNANLSDEITWLWPAAGTALGLWILLVSTWIPRGAAAAGAAALLLGLLGLPGYLMYSAHPTYRGWMDAGVFVAAAFVFVPIALTALCSIRGLRFAGGTWGAAWRGLAVLGALAGGGYAYGAQALSAWIHLTPDDPELRLLGAHLGAGGAYVFVEAGRAGANGRGFDAGSSRPWAVRLDTGAWKDLGEPGFSIAPEQWFGAYRTVDTDPGAGLLSVREWRKQDEAVRYIDGATGEIWKTLPGDVTTPELRDRLTAEWKRRRVLEDSSGRPVWFDIGKRALVRAAADGSLEEFPLSTRMGYPYPTAWGMTIWNGKSTVLLDHEAADPRTELPWEVAGLPGAGTYRLSRTQYLGRKSSGPDSGGVWLLGDLARGDVVRAKGIAPREGVSFVHAGRAYVVVTDVLVEPHVARLFRVDPATGDRDEVPLPRGLAGPAAWFDRGWEMGLRARPLVTIGLPTGARWLARLSTDGTAFSDATPVGPNDSLIALPDADHLLFRADDRRIERARWDEPGREVLFPRAK